MKTYELNKRAKVKLVFERNVELYMANDNKLEYKLKKQSNFSLKEGTLIVELFLLRDYSYYALLGAEFFPSNTNELHIVVMHGNNVTKKYLDTISYNNKFVNIGLSTEYAESVVNTTIDFFNKSNKIPSGSLIFNMAANDEVGSSIHMFSVITNVLLGLLLELERLNSDELIKDFCNERLVDLGIL